ncbi:restriction endonuclease [Thalassoporum mexicanum PCC 7367]|uniref:restriction endonuclease n=1 Tax=Thalassoporum mexicanum TaxID=3457544 RepID=UPI00029FAE68|nr:restriction endonuclease [Pseudanabaena sp. PCC 7367]AFY69577.1 restriction endonuclease [Pseudanabaena sp. PCC 7367]
MSVPDYQSLMMPVLKSAANGEVAYRDTVNLLAEALGLKEEDLTELLPSGKQTVFANRVGWAKTYLKKAGLIEYTRRGYFAITPRGKKVLESGIAQIDNQFLAQFDEFQEFRTSKSEPDEPEIIPEVEDSNTPDEIMRSAHQQINKALASELIDRILQAPPDFFERLIVRLLISMGYGGSVKEAGRVLGKSGDDGVDGVIDQDALGLDRVYVQAKRYASGNNIGAGAIRDFFGSLDRHKASKGLFVTTSRFSSSAQETADFLSKRIVLIDGAQLAKLMIRYDVGCRIEETLHLKKIDEDFFE